MIPCCQRSSSADSTAKALLRRGLLDAWRTCSVDPRSVTMISTCVSGWRSGSAEMRWHRTVERRILGMSAVERQRWTQAGSREPPWIVRTRSASVRLRGARRASNDSEPRNRGKLAKKSMMGHKKKYISKSSIRRSGEKPDCSKCPSFVTTRVKMSREAPLCDSVRDDATRPKDCLVEEGCRLSELPDGGWEEGSRPRPTPRHGWLRCRRPRDTETLLSWAVPECVWRTTWSQRQQRELARSLIWCPESCHSRMLKWGRCGCRCQKMRRRCTWPLEWSQHRCEEMQREPVRCGWNVRIKPTWKYVKTLLVSVATVTQLKFWTGMRQLTESGQSQCRCKNARCSGGVTSTKSHLCRQSSARLRPAMPRETKPRRELWHASTLTRCVHLITTRAPYEHERWDQWSAEWCRSVVHVNLSHAIRYLRSSTPGSREACGWSLRKILDWEMTGASIWRKRSHSWVPE